MSGPGGYARTHAYDGLGRPESETFVIGGESFRVGRSYDALGRVATLAYPRTGIAVGRSYTERGHLRAVYDTENPATVYWRAAAVNAEGQVLEAMLGNGIGTTRTYDPATGLIRTNPVRRRRQRRNAGSRLRLRQPGQSDEPRGLHPGGLRELRL